uniref:Fungal lipase-like domain-containing protein n=1 Tax=Meloidogyne javanica TaxID=6303 RepID=A0A915MFR6_MELJA
MAAAAYGSVDNFIYCLQTLTGSYDVFFNIQIPCLNNETCTGFMALSLEDKALILSFGTSKYAYKQLLNDSGESVFNKRRRSPLGFGSGMITGHSIGGAIASIAAAKIASANVIDAKQIKLVTFGQPRVGNKAWAAAMENAV